MNLTLIPSPYALHHYRQGPGLAPETYLAHGLRQSLEADGHTVSVAERGPVAADGPVLDTIGQHLNELAGLVARAAERGSLPVILGGDCLAAIGVVAGLRRSRPAELGIAWFDAHGDFNTPETTLSGYLGGMPLACVCGRGLEALRAATGLDKPVDETRVVMAGIRDLDGPEKALLDTTRVRIFSAAAIGDFQPPAGPTYLHFDIDALDPSLAPGVNYLTPRGLLLAPAIDAARKVRANLAAFSLTASDPTVDQTGRTIESGLALVTGILK
jgi:arginase